MLDRLSFVEGKYEELTMRISDPNVIADHERWQKLVKEHSDLESIVMKYREFKGLQEELDANMEMLQVEDDQDMREMINEDVRNIKVKLEETKTFLLKSEVEQAEMKRLCLLIISLECTPDMQKAKDGKLRS